MIVATDLRPGTVVRLEGEFYRIADAVYHAGGGKLTGTVHAKLHSLRTGAAIERRFRPDDKLGRVDLERSRWQYLYADGDDVYFMNPQTYEQIPIRRERLGEGARFLRPDMTVSVETYEGELMHIVFPEAVELRVASTGEPLHQKETSAMKLAMLENGLEILVPLFIRVDDIVRVATATGKYLERARAKGS